MKRTLIAASLALATAVGGISAPVAASAQVISIGPGGIGLYNYGGHRYCWYDGWRGPGWYWCGYGSRRGYGWGGGYGWNGWSRRGGGDYGRNHYYGGGGHYGGGGGHYGGGGGGHWNGGGGGNHGGGGHDGGGGGHGGGGHGGGEHHH